MKTLYSYFRSSAAYRVRIALNLKKIDYDSIYINLKKDAHLETNYEQINRQKLVPALVIGKDILTQSLSILEYLEEEFPLPPLLPEDSLEKARIRSFSQIIACETHPLNNLRVLKFLKGFSLKEEQINLWYHHWITEGFQALEKILENRKKTLFCFGNDPTFADICLIPQIYNALRFNCNLDPYPCLMKIYNHCIRIPEFIKASPEEQQDFCL